MFSIKESSTKVDSWVQSFKGAGLFDCLVGIDEVGVVGAKRFILAFGKAAPKWEVEEEADDDLDDEAELNSIDELDEEAEGDLEKEVDAAAKPEEEADGVAKAEPEEEADAVAEVEPEEEADFDVDGEMDEIFLAEFTKLERFWLAFGVEWLIWCKPDDAVMFCFGYLWLYDCIFSNSFWNCAFCISESS